MGGDDERDDEDRRAILSRRELLVASALSGASLIAGGAEAQRPMVCLTRIDPSPRPRQVVFSQSRGRIVVPLERVPPPIRPHLGDRTIYAAGGGAQAVPWRVVLSLDGPLVAAEGDRLGQPPHGPLPATWTVRVSEADLWWVVDLANAAWREERAPSSAPSDDYDEVIAMRDGRACFFARGHGAFRGGAARQLVDRLRRLAEGARPAP